MELIKVLVHWDAAGFPMPLQNLSDHVQDNSFFTEYKSVTEPPPISIAYIFGFSES